MFYSPPDVKRLLISVLVHMASFYEMLECSTSNKSSSIFWFAWAFDEILRHVRPGKELQLVLMSFWRSYFQMCVTTSKF